LILIDSNLLLYAADQTSPHHQTAKRWFGAVLGGSEPVAIPWVSILAFLRIITNPRLLQQPVTMDRAAAVVSAWLARSNVVVVGPTERHWAILLPLLRDAQIRGPAVTDAHIAALAIEHGATLYTADRGFARFRGLNVVDPLNP
jgi:uncharacterized protein